MRVQRDVRNRRICEVLQKLGMDVSLEEAEREAGGDVLARPHIARVLIRKGYALAMRSAAAFFWEEGAGLCSSGRRFSPEASIAMIRHCNGGGVLIQGRQNCRRSCSNAC
jgi:predicted metal-dependent phosphoesterase TrpH